MNTKKKTARKYQSGPRSDQRDKTRMELKSQALRLFAKRGFLSTQISEIAKASGVATGTFYVHFKDKDELAQVALGDFNESFLENLKTRVALVTNPDDLDTLTEMVVTAFLEHWWSHRAVVKGLAEHFSHSGQLEKLREGFSPDLVKYVAAFLEPWTAHSDQALLAAHGILGMWLRVGLRFVNEKTDRTSDYQLILYKMTIGVLHELMKGKI